MRGALALLALLAACGGAPPAPDWQSNASAALAAFQQRYLIGDTRVAEADFQRARAELARTGRGDLLARAELLRCAVRAASLEFDDCPGFHALRDVAGSEELAYAEYLAGRGKRAAAPEDTLSRLLEAALQFRSGTVTPTAIEAAIAAASAQGWRRPLLAWLGVQVQRAEAAGDSETAARLRRRMQLISG